MISPRRRDCSKDLSWGLLFMRMGTSNSKKIKERTVLNKTQPILNVTKYIEVNIPPRSALFSAHPRPSFRNRYKAQIIEPYKNGPRNLKIHTGLTWASR